MEMSFITKIGFKAYVFGIKIAGIKEVSDFTDFLKLILFYKNNLKIVFSYVYLKFYILVMLINN